MNATLLKLSASSHISSPLIASTSLYKSASIISSCFSKESSQIIFSSHGFLQNTRVFRSTFSNFLQNAFHYSSVIQTDYTQRSSNAGIATFSFCRFLNIVTSSNGGAIYVSDSAMSFVLISNLFYCCVGSTTGGAVCSSTQNFSASYNCFSLCRSLKTSSSNSWVNAAQMAGTTNSYFNISTTVQCSYNGDSLSWDGVLMIASTPATTSDINISNCYAPACCGFIFESESGSIVHYLNFFNLTGGYIMSFYGGSPSSSTIQYLNEIGCSLTSCLFCIGSESCDVSISHVLAKGYSGTVSTSLNSYTVVLSDYSTGSSSTVFPVGAVNTWNCVGSVKAPKCGTEVMTNEFFGGAFYGAVLLSLFLISE